jgi:hypothetical protein
LVGSCPPVSCPLAHDEEASAAGICGRPTSAYNTARLVALLSRDLRLRAKCERILPSKVLSVIIRGFK